MALYLKLEHIATKDLVSAFQETNLGIGQVLSSFVSTEQEKIFNSDFKTLDKDLFEMIVHWQANAAPIMVPSRVNVCVGKHHPTICPANTTKERLAYNAYRWKWIDDHGFDVTHLFRDLLAIICETRDDEDAWKEEMSNPEKMVELYQGNTNGICGCFYVCFAEFLECEYQETLMA